MLQLSFLGESYWRRVLLECWAGVSVFANTGAIDHLINSN